MEHFLFTHHYLNGSSRRYKWNKEFLKERRKKKSNLYYKVNFAQKENITKSTKMLN
jgi:hypothetical protein